MDIQTWVAKALPEHAAFYGVRAMSESPNIYQRIHAVMQEVKYVQKEKPQGMNYSVVSHDAVTAKVRPALVNHGIAYHPVDMEYQQNGNRTEVKLSVRFVNVEDPKDYIDVPAIGYGIDQQDKGPGKAVSYAVKYALLKALGLETGEDADNEQVDYGPDPSAIEEWKAKADEAATSDELTDIWKNLPKAMQKNQEIRAHFAQVGEKLKGAA